MGRLSGQAYNLMNIGDLRLELRQTGKAIDNLQQAVELFENLGNQWGAGLAGATLAEAQLATGNLAEAERQLNIADARMKAADDTFRRGLIQCSWARYFNALEDKASAHAALARARAFSQHAGAGNASYLDQQIALVRQELDAA
jgi:hypothetical protein